MGKQNTFPQANSRAFNPFERRYKNGRYTATENGGTSNIGATNFLVQTLIPRSFEEVDILKNINTIFDTDYKLQRFIKDHFPILYPYIKDEIEKCDWKKSLSPVDFVEDCFKCLKKKNMNIAIKWQESGEPMIFLVHEYDFQKEDNGYVIEFEPFLFLKEKHVNLWEILINLHRLISYKLDYWGDEYDEDIMDDLENYFQHDENIEDINQYIKEFKIGKPKMIRDEIKNSKMKLDLLKRKIKAIKTSNKMLINFKLMCLAGLELLDVKGKINDFSFEFPNEHTNASPIYPDEYCRVVWSVDCSDHIWEMSEQMNQDRFNEEGMLPFRYAQNITFSKKINDNIPEFPMKATKFLDLSTNFLCKHVYAKRGR